MTHLDELKQLVIIIKSFKRDITPYDISTFFSENLFVNTNKDMVLFFDDDFINYRSNGILIRITLEFFSISKDYFKVYRLDTTEEKLFQDSLISNNINEEFTFNEISEYAKVSNELISLLKHLVE